MKWSFRKCKSFILFLLFLGAFLGHGKTSPPGMTPTTPLSALEMTRLALFKMYNQAGLPHGPPPQGLPHGLGHAGLEMGRAMAEQQARAFQVQPPPTYPPASLVHSPNTDVCFFQRLLEKLNSVRKTRRRTPSLLPLRSNVIATTATVSDLVNVRFAIVLAKTATTAVATRTTMTSPAARLSRENAKTRTRAEVTTEAR